MSPKIAICCNPFMASFRNVVIREWLNDRNYILYLIEDWCATRDQGYQVQTIKKAAMTSALIMHIVISMVFNVSSEALNHLRYSDVIALEVFQLLLCCRGRNQGTRLIFFIKI